MTNNIDRLIEFVLATWDAIDILGSIERDYPNDLDISDDGVWTTFPGLGLRCRNACNVLYASLDHLPPVIRQQARLRKYGPDCDENGDEYSPLDMQLPLF